MKQSPKGPKRSARPKENLTDKAQSERFNEAAREFGMEETGEAFDGAIQKILIARRNREP